MSKNKRKLNLLLSRACLQAQLSHYVEFSRQKTFEKDNKNKESFY